MEHLEEYTRTRIRELKFIRNNRPIIGFSDHDHLSAQFQKKKNAYYTTNDVSTCARVCITFFKDNDDNMSCGVRGRLKH